jgi:hypothetical protein
MSLNIIQDLTLARIISSQYIAIHGGLKPIGFLLGAFTKSSSTKIVIQKARYYHLPRAMEK